jgi:hypothetical protein
MRWSLILSSFVVVQSAFGLGCLALVIPPSSEQLERRTPVGGAKISSKAYRKNSQEHAYAYKFDQTGSVTREKLKPADRLAHGQKALMIPHTDADHVFEHQMLNNHLEKHKLQFENLHPDLQKKVKSIINGPGNMAPVPAGVNRGKGQGIKQGMKGKALSPKKTRDGYTLLSYPTARKTAKDLDQAFKDHGYNFKGKTFHNTLRNTMNNAKILKPGDPSPAGSSKSSSSGSSVAGSSKGGPRRSPRFQVPVSPKKKVAMPARRSTRIAGKGKK